MVYDFSGWATKNDIRCKDGRTIRQDAFAECDGAKVPLVWGHQHGDSQNILGHAYLENRPEGVYTYCSFNETKKGQDAKKLVEHGDITALSIFANDLVQRGADVIHGAIREVSLVIAGANPEAKIETVLEHGDFDDESYGIIYSGDQTFEMAHAEPKAPAEDPEESKGKQDMANSEKTIKDVIESMTEEQKTVLYALVEEALKSEDASGEGDEGMKHNAFDYETAKQESDALIHDGLKTILADGARFGSLKESYLAHAAEYGIENIDWLFPEAKNVDGATPGFIKRNPDEWVAVVMNGVHKTPFARIKMMFADLREDSARAKGYAQKGKLKKEEVFGLLKRAVGPTTIYKKQKLDRDDIIDITDFEVVSWLKAEMRMMLEEEIARAILFGDGRTALDDDKIKEDCIIPIIKDAPLYTISQTVTPASGESVAHAIIDAAVRGQNDYEGSGNTIFFTSNATVTDMLLLEDKDGHRLYKDVKEIALAMSVNKIVKVPASIIPTGIYGLIVDLRDYNVGADKGGSINMFDDFDIDYNQQKYLMETRCSGALTKPFSAVVLKVAEAAG